VSARWYGLALGVVLCPWIATAEPALERARENIEKAVPGAARGEARAAMRKVEQEARGGGGPFSLGDFDRNAPVVIQADELEASDEQGRRVLVFRRNVEVQQGSLTLSAKRLSAVYPEGSKQPSRLEAEGGVVIREGRREARCERVVYDRPGRRLDCAGSAALRDGDDRIGGKSIRFDLAKRSVAVDGGSEVWFEPRKAESGGGQESGLPVEVPLLSDEAPVRVTSTELRASDDESGRRIAFQGKVQLSQQGTTLEAQRLEAVYPPGARQPDKLIASGGVLVREGAREARCESAEYLRLENRVRCQGGVAHTGGDRLEGDWIDFALGEEKLAVRGRTRLVLAPREPETATQ
jgi:lipopolysaccharide transport protein LptA